jgi:hypothetical protein
LFYQHRVDPEMPIEDVAGAAGELALMIHADGWLARGGG